LEKKKINKCGTVIVITTEMFKNILRNKVKNLSKILVINVQNQNFFHSNRASFKGFADFFDQATDENKKSGGNASIVNVGREWTLSDVRRKSFDDLHKLWFVLYKERNLLLTIKQTVRRNQRPISATDESRYIKVKRSMAAIKHVLGERQKIGDMLRKKEQDDSSKVLNN
jgi:large subunit ribosomal protein L47